MKPVSAMLRKIFCLLFLPLFLLACDFEGLGEKDWRGTWHGTSNATSPSVRIVQTQDDWADIVRLAKNLKPEDRALPPRLPDGQVAVFVTYPLDPEGQRNPKITFGKIAETATELFIDLKIDDGKKIIESVGEKPVGFLLRIMPKPANFNVQLSFLYKH